MAHIGSYVPAEAAVVGLVDRIFTRISAQESCVWLGLCGKRGSDAWCRVSVPQSTFTIDARQIAQMLKQSSSRSLLLIDEFVRTPDGAAVLVQRWLTQHTRAREPQLAVRFGAHACRFVACCCAETCGHPDGMALLAATINHLTRREATEPDKSGVARGGCPRTIVCTHFREMLLRGFVNMIPRTAHVQVYQMELMGERVCYIYALQKHRTGPKRMVVCPQPLHEAQIAEDFQSIVPLFRVAPGVCAVCATKAKIPIELFARAMQVGVHTVLPSCRHFVACVCLCVAACVCVAARVAACSANRHCHDAPRSSLHSRNSGVSLLVTQAPKRQLQTEPVKLPSTSWPLQTGMHATPAQ